MTTPRCLADEDICDGEWHTCYNCGGSGEMDAADSDDDDWTETCLICSGAGGWECPYPLSRSAEVKA